MDAKGTYLGAPAARDTRGKPVYPVFAYRIPVAVGGRADFSLHRLLRPIAVFRLLRLDFCLNLDLRNSCRHAFTCAKKEQATGPMSLQGSGFEARKALPQARAQLFRGPVSGGAILTWLKNSFEPALRSELGTSRGAL
jgi:hypothetical protein